MTQDHKNKAIKDNRKNIKIRNRQKVEEGMISQQRFFETLFEDTKGYIEIRTIDKQGKVKQSWYKVEEIGKLVQDLKKPKYLKTNVYFGVCARDSQEGKEKNVCQVNCLWTDIDAKNIKQKGVIKKKLELFNPEPSIIVSSGKGYHCYWLLKKSEKIKSQKDIDRLKGYNKGLAQELGADTQAIDLSRVLRVPNTKNLKDQENILIVRIVKSDPETKYSLKKLSRFFVKIEKIEIDKVDIDQVEIPERFYQVMSDTPKLEKTWQGKRPDLKDQTRSGYDMSLASQLVRFGFSTSEIASILRNFLYGKRTDAQGDYLEWTIGKAKREYEERKNKEQTTRANSNVGSQDSKKEEQKARIKEVVDRFVEEEGFEDYQLYKEKFKSEQFWVSDGLIPKRGFILLAGHKARGKSTLAIQLCLKLIIGNCTFLKDFEIKESPRKILYWYAENADAEIQKIRRTQQESLGIKLTKEQHNRLFWLKRKRLDFKNRDSLILIKGIVEKINPDIIILDTLHRFMVGLDQNKIETADKLFDILEDIKPDCLWFFISHLRKPSRQDIGDTIYSVIGSSSLVNDCDTVIIMSRAHNRRAETREDRLRSKIEFTVKRARILNPVFVELNEETRSLELIEREEIANQKAVTEKDLCKFIKKEFEGAEATGGQIEEKAKKKFGISKSRVYQLLKEAQDSGLLTYTKPKGKKKGGTYHALYW